MTDLPPPGEERPASPGRALAAAREARGLTVADVAMRIKFSPRQIEALEGDDFGALPGGTFARGMVRAYARFLDLDPEPLVRDAAAALDGRAPAIAAVPDLKVPFQQGPRRSGRIYALLSLAVIVAAGLVVGDWVLRAREEARLAAVAPPAPAPQPAAAEPQPAAAPTADEAPAPQASPREEPASPPLVEGVKRVQLEFAQDSWVEIRDAEGKTLLSQVNAAGSRRVVEGVPPLTVVIGNASGVRMSVNDEALDLKPFTRVDVARLTLD
ncbi:MAG: DUF4115 domain-containing protein [Burkholderiales bacterium]|nr:DUF4115 domain-containing protein [Burkholderiales bacterium]